MWPNPHETADLVTFTEEIPNGKLRFLCSATGFFMTETFAGIYKPTKIPYSDVFQPKQHYQRSY